MFRIGLGISGLNKAKSNQPPIRISAGKTAEMQIPPQKWTPWIVCDGTYFRTGPDGPVRIKFSDGAQFEDGPDQIVNFNEKTDRMIFRVYNPSTDTTVKFKVSVK